MMRPERRECEEERKRVSQPARPGRTTELSTFPCCTQRVSRIERVTAAGSKRGAVGFSRWGHTPVWTPIMALCLRFCAPSSVLPLP